MVDLVIRNGFVVDGSGAPGQVMDVAIQGSVIVAVGKGLEPGRREIDAEGLLVTPGFVDMHTHYDGQVTWDPYLTPSGWHGVTTVVMGNCGVGFAPVRVEDREWLINVMEGVEDIPGSALSEGIRWDWQSFEEYLDALDGQPRAVDVATQVPHSAVRGYVMGQHGSENDAATPEQIAQMRDIVADGLRAGALGFSTSRTTLHKTADGVFVAGTFAEVEELKGISEAFSETGLGVFEIANEHATMPTDIAWMEEIATSTGRPVVFNLSQIDFAPELWREVVVKLEEARERGAPLYAQCAGRAIGILMNWRVTAHPFALCPAWQALSQLPWDEHLARLRDPAVKAEILSDTPLEVGVFEAYITRSFDKMYLMNEGTDYEPRPEESLAARAEASGQSAAELAYDAMLEADGTGFLYFPLFNYADGDLELLRELHSHAAVRMGLSDGGAHCGAICDAGMPTFMLTHWVRDRSRGPTLPLEYMVMRQTRQTAEFYGLHDRGLVAPGMRADLNIIDFDALKLRAPEVVFDLPAGGRRLVQRADGYRYTVCAGEITFELGKATGALPGQLIRGPQSGPDLSQARSQPAPSGRARPAGTL